MSRPVNISKHKVFVCVIQTSIHKATFLLDRTMSCLGRKSKTLIKTERSTEAQKEMIVVVL